MRVNYLIVWAACGLSASLFVQQSHAANPEPADDHLCQEAITVFQDVSLIGRKDGAARNISRKHREMAKEGWRFADMEPYTENGDLEGFYLSYTRDIACAAQKQD